MTSRAPVQCRACVRWLRTTGTCEAFPRGIPPEIQLFGADHREPFPGDGGIRFQLGSGAQEAEDFANWGQVFGQQ